MLFYIVCDRRNADKEQIFICKFTKKAFLGTLKT